MSYAQHKDRLQDISTSLTAAQRSMLLSADPHDISRYHYAPFKGASLGLFQVAPGWERMELSPLGLTVRSHLEHLRLASERTKTFGVKLVAHCPYDETALRVDLTKNGEVAICPCCWTNFDLPKSPDGAAA